jgi:YHS domain-containing protein
MEFLHGLIVRKIKFALETSILFRRLESFMQTDPVCGMQIDEGDAAGQSRYEGRTYYFCSSSCKEQFDADPTRFTANESEIQN